MTTVTLILHLADGTFARGHPDALIATAAGVKPFGSVTTADRVRVGARRGDWEGETVGRYVGVLVVRVEC